MTIEKNFDSVFSSGFPKRDIMHFLLIAVNRSFRNCKYSFDVVQHAIIFNGGVVPLDDKEFQDFVRLFWVHSSEFDSAFGALYSFRSLYGHKNVLKKNVEQRQSVNGFNDFVNGLFV